MRFRALAALLSDIGTAVRASRTYSDLSLAAGAQADTPKPDAAFGLTGLLPR